MEEGAEFASAVVPKKPEATLSATSDAIEFHNIGKSVDLGDFCFQQKKICKSFLSPNCK